MIMSNDKKWSKRTIQAPALGTTTAPRQKTILFIRHAESEWNAVFNRGVDISMLYRGAQFLYHEGSLMFHKNSIIVDAPLSSRGILQAQALGQFLHDTYITASHVHHANVLELVQDRNHRKKQKKSLLVSSNLRRARATLEHALRACASIHVPQEVHVLSCLQEIGSNFDTLALDDFESYSSWTSSSGWRKKEETEEVLPNRVKELQCNYTSIWNRGNKSLRENGQDRIQTFARWCFEQEESDMIVCGHSLWILRFFQLYLPKWSSHVAKTKKFQNCAAIRCTFLEHRDDDGRGVTYQVDPVSIEPIYLGFKT